MKPAVRCSSLALLALSLIPMPVPAGEVPLWEGGAGVAVIDFPDYRGSDERNTYVLPVPYFVYRGKYLKIDREKVRGLLFKTERVELDVSLSGSVPVKSSDNEARQGMPDLDPTLEIGPALNLALHRSAGNKTVLELRLPVRPVIDINADYQGYVFQPQLNLDVQDPAGYTGWNLGLLVGPVFADGRYHQYIYGVDPAYATDLRPAYTAHGGYAGSQFIGALSKRFPNYWVGGFVKWDSLHGATFEDSPLLRESHSFTAGFAISWIFGRSKTMVQEDPQPGSSPLAAAMDLQQVPFRQ
jgi:outer membrane scaffolding protein for murein synthesis (MipA/OmpV family)